MKHVPQDAIGAGGALAIERFWSKVDKSGDCWMWTGAATADGYGNFKVRSYATVRAHRFSWQIATGQEIPSGLVVCHRCDTPLCVKPDHLFLGTVADNNRDMAAKGRLRGKESLVAARRALRAQREARWALRRRGVS